MTLPTLDRHETDSTMATKAIAERHKRMIEEYWADQGAVVTVKLVEAGFSSTVRSKFFELESDLVNGYPPKRTGAVLHTKAA